MVNNDKFNINNWAKIMFFFLPTVISHNIFFTIKKMSLIPSKNGKRNQ